MTMAKTASFAGAGIIVVGATAGLAQELTQLPQHQDPYFEQGQATIEAVLAQQPNTNTAKNVILFIADGFGVSSMTAARIFQGQEAGGMGEEHILNFEKFPYAAVIKTYNTDKQVPDSAGTATAMHTGVKTRAGVIGVNSSVERGKCEQVAGNEVVSILQLAEMAGRSTGVITTTRVTHATPAAAYAHSADRTWEDDKDMAGVTGGCHDIARQLIEFPYGNGLEVAMGGGRRSFLPTDMGDPEEEGRNGERLDRRDLTKEWQAKRDGAAYVWNANQFQSLDMENTTAILGLFNGSHMQYEADREKDPAGEPSLSEMVSVGIDLLATNDEGYFLQVESGRVDHAHHASNAYRAMVEADEFTKAIDVALEKVNLNETLIVVTADHSHTFVIQGYPERGNPILGLAKANGEILKATDGLPYTTVAYTNGPGAVQGERQDLSNVDVEDMDYVQQATIPLWSETHSGEDVLLYAQGPFAHLFQGNVEQSYIYHVMDYASKISEQAMAAADGSERMPKAGAKSE